MGFLESLISPHSLRYYRRVGTCLIMLVCLLLCILVIVIKFLYIFCKTRRFSTMWHVRRAKAQTSLRIRAV